MPESIDRDRYNALYGATTGDRVRLADTNLFIRVERDDSEAGSELLTGFGRPVRDGMLIGRQPGPSKLDLLVTNVVVLDPALGVIKTNIGIKNGRIVGIGRAGNPDVSDNVDLVLSASTGMINGDGLIATPGGVDSHVHLSSTSLIGAALTSGLTTLVGQGSGGVWDLGVNPAANLRHVFEAFESIPLNLALLGRGSSSRQHLEEEIESGNAGLKIHEDVGAFPAVIDACLSMADLTGVQVAIHTDGLNEAGALSETISAIAGRSIHAYHVEGSGGGHAPNLLEIVHEANIIGSSTNPTIPFSVNSVAEQHDMIIAVHRLSPLFETDLAAVRDRIRASTIAAEDVLHDIGAISIMSSDSQGMGRIGEVISRTWQLAHRMKEVRGGGYDVETGEGDDNPRVLQYLAKYTINPALAHGLAHQVGSLEPGKLADIVLWHPAFFGAKPQLVIKGGFVAWAAVGDGVGSTRSSQPLIYRPMFGGLGRAPSALSLNFISGQALEAGFSRKYHLSRVAVAVQDTRETFKSAMRYNTANPSVRVNPYSYEVEIDGQLVDIPPAESLPLTQRYFVG
ncbi:MAG TPA: urease subunit alpha [Nitrolancea sp.]